MIGSADTVAAAEHRYAGGDACLDPLEGEKRCVRAPELLVRAKRIDLPAGVEPGPAVVAAESLHQRVPGMSMGVDQARQHQHAGGIDDFGAFRCADRFAGSSDGQDPSVPDMHRAAADNAPAGVHRDDDTAAYHKIAHRRSTANNLELKSTQGVREPPDQGRYAFLRT